MARVYADVNATLGESWYDYGKFLCVYTSFAKVCAVYVDNFRIDWSRPERYEVVRRIGGGKYSEVRNCAWRFC